MIGRWDLEALADCRSRSWVIVRGRTRCILLLRLLRSGRSRGVPVEISDEEPLVRHVHSHVVRRIAGVESVADDTD